MWIRRLRVLRAKEVAIVVTPSCRRRKDSVSFPENNAVQRFRFSLKELILSIALFQVALGLSGAISGGGVWIDAVWFPGLLKSIRDAIFETARNSQSDFVVWCLPFVIALTFHVTEWLMLAVVMLITMIPRIWLVRSFASLIIVAQVFIEILQLCLLWAVGTKILSSTMLVGVVCATISITILLCLRVWLGRIRPLRPSEAQTRIGTYSKMERVLTVGVILGSTLAAGWGWMYLRALVGELAKRL